MYALGGKYSDLCYVAPAHTLTHTHSRTHTHTYIHTHIHTHTHTRTLTHTHTHAHTHAHTHTRAHTLPHTCTYPTQGCCHVSLTSDTARLHNCTYATNAGFFNTHTGCCVGNLITNGTPIQVTMDETGVA